MTVLADTHQNMANTWTTPPEWLEWVDATLGVDASFNSDWFDPCPADFDLETYVSALEDDWDFPCYVNHPGSRGSTGRWWDKSMLEMGGKLRPFIWCAFSIEQLRFMEPSPFELPGWLVMPKQRIGFIWGGPTFQPERGKRRVHGERNLQPANWTVFWTTVEPADPPIDCVISRTGV